MLKQYSIAATFGISAPASMKVEGFAPTQNPNVPTQKPYVFRKEHLRDVLAFTMKDTLCGRQTNPWLQ